MKIYMVDHANLVITIISLFVRELFAQLFPASLLVSPKVAIELKKEDITIYFDISKKRKKNKMEISDILIYHYSDGDIDERFFLTLL